ncbi:hypothetical protein QBC40DRAFT_280242 [Triangularia verruculosa]|uniref:Tim44-like domain-containing protein n=1 Tax=Triangularia verruculosa TaxID=2587418 RepID=A0AAN6XGP1_9PEZI|nr:hypothetical protein QBC40DRAFT_280242 [Triangularia verruculosa]
MASVYMLGLSARGMLSSKAVSRISPRVVRTVPTCSFSTSHPLERANRSNARSVARENLRSPSAQIAQQKLSQKVTSNAINIIFPGTFVRPPWKQWPKDLKSRFAFFKIWVKIKSQEAATKFAMKFSSRPKFYKSPALKTSNSASILTAKALHRSMMEALASGDKDTIRKVCASKVALPLQATIDTRPKHKKVGWELVEYTKTWVYPRVLSHKISPIEKSKDAPIIEQVVVAISSKQRRYQFINAENGERKKLVGTEKEMDVIENIVIGSVIDPHTWRRDEWRIIGSLKPTDPAEWAEEEKLVKFVEHQEAMKR